MDKIRKIIKEELGSAEEKIFTRIKRIFEDGMPNSAQISMKLQFKNTQSIFTGDQIKGEGDTCIEVALVDSTGNVVEVGPEAFATVEIILLRGEHDEGDDDWTVDKFNENIVGEMEGKKLLLGKQHLKLQRGICVVNNIKFRHCLSEMRSSRFRLGARIIDMYDGVHIKEAKTNCFSVKDYRGKYYEKSETPSLSDAVSRLSNIRKGGEIEKRLQDNNIYTVENFLIQLLIDPEGLQKNIVQLQGKKWEVVVSNARACPSDKRIYCYIDSEQTKGILFNVRKILGLYLNNQYTPISKLSENHKADAQELLSSAYKNWDDVKIFDHDDENSLEKHLSGLSTDHRGEMMGESSSRSNFSYQSMSSAMNSITESGLGDSSFFSIDDVPTIDYDFLQLSPPPAFDPLTMFEDFEEFLKVHDNFNPIANEQIATTAGAFIEPGDFEMNKPPKRWKKLFCVSRLFSIRKKVSIGGNRNRKKQKIC